MRSVNPTVLPIALVFMAASAGASERLFLERAAQPCWSPDGRTIACVRPTPMWDFGHLQIWGAPLDGGPPDTLIVDPRGAHSPMWLPDGHRIVYYTAWYDERERYGFVVHDLDTGSSRTLEADNVWDDWGFCLSPGGAEVLYTCDMGGGPGETRALDLTTGAVRFVAQGMGGAISPDGEWVACSSETDSLVVMPVHGGPARVFEPGGYPSWTPDSRYIVFTGLSTNGEMDLFVMARNGTYRSQLTHDPEENLDCDVSPAGDAVVYAKSSDEFAPYNLWIVDLNLPHTSVQNASWSRIKQMYRPTRR